jgi:hypothetical protein
MSESRSSSSGAEMWCSGERVTAGARNMFSSRSEYPVVDWRGDEHAGGQAKRSGWAQEGKESKEVRRSLSYGRKGEVSQQYNQDVEFRIEL